MGSPENYYGVFGELRHPGGGITTTTSTAGTTSLFASTAVPSVNWSNPGNADATPNTSYAVSSTADGSNQHWSWFGLQGTGGAHPGHEHRRDRGPHVFPAHRVRHDDHQLSAACPPELGQRRDVDELADVGCALDVQDVADVRRSGEQVGSHRGPARARQRRTAGPPDVEPRVAVRPEPEHLGGHLQVRVSYHYPVSTFTPDTNVAGPAGAALTPRGFWGVMHGWAPRT